MHGSRLPPAGSARQHANEDAIFEPKVMSQCRRHMQQRDPRECQHEQPAAGQYSRSADWSGTYIPLLELKWTV
jgi:hypothetical protein